MEYSHATTRGQPLDWTRDSPCLYTAFLGLGRSFLHFLVVHRTFPGAFRVSGLLIVSLIVSLDSGMIVLVHLYSTIRRLHVHLSGLQVRLLVIHLIVDRAVSCSCALLLMLTPGLLALSVATVHSLFV